MFGTFTDRLYLLISPLGEASGSGATTLKPVGASVFALLLLLFYLGRCRDTPHLHIAQQMKGPLIAILMLCLLLPEAINGVALVHIRFPFVLIVLLITATRWQNLGQATARVVATAITASLILRGGELYLNAADYSRDIATLKQVLASAPKGSRILPIRSEGNERDTRFWHVQAYAVPMAESFVPTLFQGVHSLRLKPEWSNSAHPAAMSIDERRLFDTTGKLINPDTDDNAYFWSDWQRKFTHLLLIDPQPVNWHASKKLQQINRHGRFTLFEIQPF